MKRTLLDLTQSILSDMNGDEVNSITDTVESEQVASIIKETFLEMSSNRNWPLHKQPLQIPSYGDVTKPTHMQVPASMKELLSLNYNTMKTGETRLKYEPINYVDNDVFLRKTNKENNTASNVQIVIDPSGVQLLIRNDRAPTCYTSFNDETIVFDSFDSGVDSSLQESKIQAIAYMQPTWVHTDSHVIDLPTDAFSALLNEAKSAAFLDLRQTSNAKAEQRSKRQQRWLSRNSWAVAGGIQYPNYGRKGRKVQTNPLFEKNN